ncbi:integrase arm-type DNA-binding domain-containing protein [Microvirga sp. HBU67558]|uniref:tyrosine-type recombinase/integrase n=1 Tax=Microvirga TaxID=186650 RepID=UPI001B370C43|nr:MULTISPECIES: site-specific integrase [unclassified Microvirga]MBQ0824255.1 integrase arm-type DNA-binding domain-containing protein [Microvirga sp. HBU67558]
MRKALTNAFVRSVAAPVTGRTDITDDRCEGLALRITAAGVKSWCFRFRDPRTGKDARSTIGRYPDLSLAQARARASDLRREVASGSNPVEKKYRERQEAQTKTFAALAERYLQEHACRFKRSAAADERNLRLHVLPRWADRRFDEIQRRDVIALCEGMVAAGTATNANRVQALISSIFSFAVDADLVGANPCSRLRKRGLENIGRRVLTDDEIHLFWYGIVQRPVSRPVGLALRIALLTAARVSEIAEAERREFQNLDDPERAAWQLPAERSKNGRAHFVPLSRLARESVLEALTLADETSPHLFPSPSVEGAPITGHALSVGMARFGRRLEGNHEPIRSWQAEPPSPHDLRRTVATRLASLGVPAEDVSAVLNHARRSVTGIHYDLYDRAGEKRRALNLLGETIRRLIQGSSVRL